MNKHLRKGAMVAGAVFAAAAGWWSWDAYSSRRKVVDDEIARYREGLEVRDVELQEAPRLAKAFDELAIISLGASEEEANAVMRRALNEMAAYVGLRRAQVATASSKAQVNPAVRTRLREFRAREVRERPDFYTLSATLTGEGSLDQAVRTIALLNTQEWVCRVDAFSMRAEGKEREGIDLSVTVTGIYVRGSKSPLAIQTEGRIWRPLDEASLDPWRSIVSKNVFREPPPPPPPAVDPAPVVTEVAAPAVPPSPPAPSLADWRITAVVQAHLGPELWLVNLKTGETRMLAPGNEVLGAIFVTGSGEMARIKIGEEVFEVRLGSTLAERKSVS